MGNAEGAVNRKTSPTPWPLHLTHKKEKFTQKQILWTRES